MAGAVLKFGESAASVEVVVVEVVVLVLLEIVASDDADADTDTTVPDSDACLTSRLHLQFGHTIFNDLTLVSDSSW